MVAVCASHVWQGEAAAVEHRHRSSARSGAVHGRRGRTKPFREFYTINAAQTSPAGLLAGISSVLHAASLSLSLSLTAGIDRGAIRRSIGRGRAALKDYKDPSEK